MALHILFYSSKEVVSEKMAPQKKKKRITDSIGIFIIHFDDCKDHNFTQLNEERFQKIQSITDILKRQPKGSREAYEDICRKLLDTFDNSDG